MEGAAIERALTQLLGKPSARKEVIEALVRYGERVTDLLIEQVEAEDLETRRAAVIALGRIGDPKSVPALLRVLTQDSELVMVTAGALAKLGDPRAFETLLSMIGPSGCGGATGSDLPPLIRSVILKCLSAPSCSSTILIRMCVNRW